MKPSESILHTLLEAATDGWVERPPTAAQIGIDGLFDSLSPTLENKRIALDVGYVPERPLFWPSTLDYIETQCGGFYGVTTFAADKGTGKTMLATASAIEAAASGDWQVVMFLAEDDLDGWLERFNIYLNAHEHAIACIPRLHVVHVGTNQTPQSLSVEILRRIELDLDIPILVCIDSINSVVNLGNGQYLESLRKFGLWAMLARRLARGRVSFMLTTESNKRGESKGENLPFWSDQYLKMTKKSKNVVEFTLDKTRRTGGEGVMGQYVREWASGLFVPEHAARRAALRVVNGGPVPAPFGIRDPEPDEEPF